MSSRRKQRWRLGWSWEAASGRDGAKFLRDAAMRCDDAWRLPCTELKQRYRLLASHMLQTLFIRLHARRFGLQSR